MWWLSGTLHAQSITKAEYFINDHKDGKQITLDETGEDIEQSFPVDLDGISEGLHFLGVRVMDENGNWSVPTIRTFLVHSVSDLPNIVKAEYIIDDGDPVAIDGLTAGTDVTISSFNVDLDGIAPGLHFLQVRVQDDLQRWSVVTVRAFLVDDDQELEKITKLSYYYYDIAEETILGEFEHAIEPPATSIETDFQANATLLVEQKQYLMYIWAETESGKLSLVNIRQFQFIERPPIEVSIDATDVSCFGGNDGTIKATASKGEGPPYEYSINGVDYQKEGMFEDIPKGIYTIYVRDSKKDYVHTVEVPVDQTDSLGLSTEITHPSCAEEASGSIKLNVTNFEEGITYKINDGDFQESIIFTGLIAGEYTITAKKADGCEEITNVTLVDQNPKPKIFELKPDLNTDPPTLFVSASGATKYEWFRDGNIIVGANDATIKMTEGGTYKVRASNDAGCNEEAEYTFGLSLSVEKTDVSCPNGTNGKLIAAASEGEAPYEYKLNDNPYQESGTFEGLSPGEHTIFAKDNKGTETLKKVTILAPDNISIVALPTDATCKGAATGQIAVSATGGTGTFQFKLGEDEFNTTSTFTNLNSGEYTITAMDENGCTQTAQVTISNKGNGPTPVPLIIREGNETSETSTLTVNNANDFDLGILWFKDGKLLGGELSETLELTEAGEYTAVFIDENNCQSKAGEVVQVTGLEELLEATTKVYPVPANDWINVEVPYGKTGNVTIHLINTSGQVLQRKDVKPDGNSLDVAFETGTLPDGLYIILLQGDDFNVMKKFQKASR